jgi:chromosome segregation ATPase
MSNPSEREAELTKRVNDLTDQLSSTKRFYYQLQDKNSDLENLKKKLVEQIEVQQAQITRLNTENQDMNAEIRRLGRVEVQLQLEITHLKSFIPTQPQNGGRSWF